MADAEPMLARLVRSWIAMAFLAGVPASPYMRCRQGRRAQLHGTRDGTRANRVQLATGAGGGGRDQPLTDGSTPGTRLDRHGLHCWRAGGSMHAPALLIVIPSSPSSPSSEASGEGHRLFGRLYQFR